MQAIAGVGSASKGCQGHVGVHGLTGGTNLRGLYHRVAAFPFFVPPMGQPREAGEVPGMHIERGRGARVHRCVAMVAGSPGRLIGRGRQRHGYHVWTRGLKAAQGVAVLAGGGILLSVSSVPVPIFQAVYLFVGPQQPIERRRGQGRPRGVTQGPGEQRHAAAGAGQGHVGQA